MIGIINFAMLFSWSAELRPGAIDVHLSSESTLGYCTFNEWIKSMGSNHFRVTHISKHFKAIFSFQWLTDVRIFFQPEPILICFHHGQFL